MKKRVLAVLILALLAAGGVFAQEEDERFGGKKNFISAELGLIVTGLRYERILGPRFSLGANLYWSNSFFIYNEMEIGILGRWYPIGGLYAELGLGFHIHTGLEKVEYELSYTEIENGKTVNKTKTDTITTAVTNTGFAVSPALGYKFDPGKPGGFFVEPQITVPITIGNKKDLLGYGYDKFGVSVGVVFAVGMGWSF
jgi:hypothetical protein